MPAFTFEKIAPPAGRKPTPPAEEKSRFVIVQVLGRLVERRLQRAKRVNKIILSLRERRQPE